VWGRRKKESGGFPIAFLCSRIYNFWGLLMNSKGLLTSKNEKKRCARALWISELKRTCAVFPLAGALPFINSNQQSPKVVDPAAQKYY